jgi:hypothetical protein
VTNAADIAAVLERAKQTSAGFIACCPAHDDREPSLSIADGDKGPVVHCHAGCEQGSVLDALAGLGVELRRPKSNGNGYHAEPAAPLTLASLGHAKALRLGNLTAWGVCELEAGGVGFEYRNRAGDITGMKIRRALGPDRGFRWRNASTPSLYGLWRLEDMLALDGRIVICEGETDALTLWQHDFCALGLPGASMWKDEWLADLPSDGPLYFVIEPDKGGQSVLAALAKSAAWSRARLIRMEALHKDPSALYLSDPDVFADRFEALIKAAKPAFEPRIKLRQAAEIVAEPVSAAWLLRPYLEQMVLALMYGELGTLKSFVTLDMLLHVAAGKPWGNSNFSVNPQPVVYVSAEGKGLAKRLHAWSIHHSIDLVTIPFYAIEQALDLSTAEGLDELIDTIHALKIEPRVVAIDTLSRNVGPLDENATGEMAGFLNALDAKVRQPLRCSVLLVHHVGHGAKERARGSYVLMGNTDANFFLERPDPLELTIKITTGRLKDSDSPPPIFFKAKVVELGALDEDNQPQTSLVLLPTNDFVEKKRPPGGQKQRALLRLLCEEHSKGPTTWDQATIRKLARDQLQMSKSTAQSCVDALIDHGHLKLTIGGLVLADPPDKRGT